MAASSRVGWSFDMPKKPAPKSIFSVRHYNGIGRVVVEWARLEYRMIRALAYLAGTDQASAIVTFWHMGYHEKRDRLHSLFLLPKRDEKLQKRFSNMLSRLDESYDFRNLVAHSVWKKGKARTITPIVIRAKGGTIRISGFNLKEDPISSARLVDEAQKISRLQDDFKEFFRSHLGFDLDVAPTKNAKKRAN
jgi:hypothetical protein